jgi:hypothetical protein
MAARPRKPRTAAQVGAALGFRSGLEDVVAEQLRAEGIPFDYESVRIPFVPSAKPRRYTPDFPLMHNGIVVETKGRFLTEDRQKHKLIKEQHPDIDIRFVFSNSRQRISKQSQTTYALWCQSHGFKFADVRIPVAWLREPPNEKSIAALRRLLNPPRK